MFINLITTESEGSEEELGATAERHQDRVNAVLARASEMDCTAVSVTTQHSYHIGDYSEYHVLVTQVLWRDNTP